MNLFNQVGAASEVGARLFGFGDVIALTKYHHALRLAQSVRKNDAAANELIALLGVDAEPHVHFDRFVEFGSLHLLEHFDGLRKRLNAVLHHALHLRVDEMAELLPRRGGTPGFFFFLLLGAPLSVGGAALGREAEQPAAATRKRWPVLRPECGFLSHGAVGCSGLLRLSGASRTRTLPSG